MSDDVAALRRVVEAARAALARALDTQHMTTAACAPGEKLVNYAQRQSTHLLDRMRSLPGSDREAIIRALSAFPAASPPVVAVGEAVEVALWKHSGGDLRLAVVNSEQDASKKWWRRLGTVRLTVDRTP
jgi:hypothetical protein